MTTPLGYIFDKDGTLTDLQARWSPVFAGMIDRLADGDEEVARQLADAVDLDHETQLVIPNGLAAVGNAHQLGTGIRTVLRAAGFAEQDMDELVRSAFREAPEGPLVALGDVGVAMSALARRGVRLGVATADNRDNALVELTQLGVAHLVDELRCGDDDGPVKPDPEVLWSICRAWGLDVADVTFVGDSHQDQRCAVAAGMRYVSVGHAGESPDGPPDAVISEIGDLL